MPTGARPQSLRGGPTTAHLSHTYISLPVLPVHDSANNAPGTHTQTQRSKRDLKKKSSTQTKTPEPERGRSACFAHRSSGHLGVGAAQSGAVPATPPAHPAATFLPDRSRAPRGLVPPYVRLAAHFVFRFPFRQKFLEHVRVSLGARAGV